MYIKSYFNYYNSKIITQKQYSCSSSIKWRKSTQKLIFLVEFSPTFADSALLKVVEYPRSIMKNTRHLI